MSGIAGVFFRDGHPLNRLVVADMLEVMAYRGPDGSEIWCEGSVGMGNLNLHTTPESLHGKFTNSNKTGRFVIAADARIDNRAEVMCLLAMQIQLGHVTTDSEILLQAYETWGDHSGEKLAGDFAYCIWDRIENRLFCSRDPFGVRPFYYYLNDDIFAFASEIRPLLKVNGIPRKLNEIMVADHLVGLQDDQTITFYRDILRLPPGHCMTISPHTVATRRYWSLDPSRELRLDSDNEYAEAFRELFFKAVKYRLRSSHPVATTLSGGLDSSGVTCVARNLLAVSGIRPLTTLSLIYDNVRECDEREFIKYILAQGGLRPMYFQADEATPLPYLNLTGPFYHDDPLDAPNSFAASLMPVLSGQGIRVVLDGFDGDNTVSHGYARLAELTATMRFITLVREARAICSREQRSLGDLLWRKAFRPLTPAFVRRTWRWLGGYGNRPWPKDSLISQAFANRMGLAQRYRELQAFYLKPVAKAREDHCRRLLWGGLTHALESTNKLAARNSIEVRHPFFDLRLVEFCVAIPHRQKISNGWTRLVMRRAMDGILPEEIQWRVGKVDFTPSILHAIINVERSLLDDVLRQCQKALDTYTDPQALAVRFKCFLSNPTAYDPSPLWPVLALGLWLDRSGLRP